MNNHTQAAPRANPIPTLHLVGVPFTLVTQPEPGREDRAVGEHVLWSAARTGDLWQLHWNGPACELRLSFNGVPLWTSFADPGEDSIQDLAAFRGIVAQFESQTREVPPTTPAPTIAQRALGAVRAAFSSPRAALKTLWSLLRTFLMFAGAVLCLTILAQCTGALPVKGAAAPAPAAAPSASGMLPPELRDRTLGETLSPTEMQVVANITRELGIQMRASGQPFVVFSDPNCPSCKDLEPKLSQIDPRFVPVIVPVAFKPGSAEAVQRVLCAKDTVSAWQAAIGGHAPVGDAVSDGSCADAAEKVTKANGAFVALNFSATPTIVSATGKLVVGSGPLADINQWLDKNGGLPVTAASQH
ncbi:MAG: thioredoxin fold domain-containing protein [Proteobacteria bacterium]|nr:thioredoxin fold domain-containing protein [Pseudomonadota bacterium]